ncbi:MAG: hypothetical protein IJU76_12855 [Desulfovibrionaceae bacterium]|nr:hypothetical protein [Desulfovibrionaceae bacterium]
MSKPVLYESISLLTNEKPGWPKSLRPEKSTDIASELLFWQKSLGEIRGYLLEVRYIPLLLAQNKMLLHPLKKIEYFLIILLENILPHVEKKR